MSLHETPEESALDPRVRRTRKWVGDALAELVQEKPFADISISDITRRAGIARVTFYQHFDSKEAALLALISDFFEQLYQMFDIDAIRRSSEAGIRGDAERLEIAAQLDPKQANLLRVALEHVGPDVRKLAVTWFAQTLVQGGHVTDAREAQVLATYHVSGMLALLESFLKDDLQVSEAELKRATLELLDVLLHHAAGTQAAVSDEIPAS